jgi:hypothetical protein
VPHDHANQCPKQNSHILAERATLHIGHAETVFFLSNHVEVHAMRIL